MKVIGLMSGTSFDAIEAAAAELHLEGEDLALTPLGARSVDYSEELHAAIAGVLPPAHTTAEHMCMLDTRIGQEFASAAALAARELCGGRADLIVSHGQTVYHWVEGNRVLGTLQLGQPAWIAERTGSPVVSDLRSRDVATGGHGAPLVSLFDSLLLRDIDGTRAALNLGGIANLTIIPAQCEPVAFDVGPANSLIDAAIHYLTAGAQTFDREGRRAARGTVHEELLRLLLDDPYFDFPPPKSTGKEHFNLPYLIERLAVVDQVEEDDLIATVTALTATTVARALNDYGVRQVVASGGGTRNPELLRLLGDRAPHTHVSTIDSWGIESAAKEAYAFGVLGFLSVLGIPATVPSCTGAREARVLGNVTPGSGPIPYALPGPARVGPARLRIAAEQ